MDPVNPSPPVTDDLGDPLASWEWLHLLDFPVDDVILDDDADERPLPQPSAPPPQPTSSSPVAAGGRVRKRDPRLLCENFLAGRVPCACPELDALAAAEEEEAVVGMAIKKRVKGGGSAALARCQVTGCDVDISELKGYHRRHRVCLRCANAVSVLLNGAPKRYCQQCGKFHVLADFDEGKRSCRRKLEKHNRRRRRRPTDDRNILEKDAELDEKTHLDFAHEEPKLDEEVLIDSEDHGSPFGSGPSIRTGHSTNVASCAVSSDTQVEERSDHPKHVISSSICENKSTYSTMCPAGRISFKLYDWNPAEFPRRLRLQIFQWLASMPVELEGYIRPGCTILTAFIAMPHSMWDRLSDDTAQYLHYFFKEPQNLFFGRGDVHIYLNNTHYQLLRDGTSLVNVKMEVQVPKLHYVYPLFFEAGKPVEFIVCGTNLLQPKFRFLVSFAGKYLAGETCHVVSHENTESGCNIEGGASQDSEHQILKIKFPLSEADVFGPAFVEVENESGLSNFIPVLFADKDTCVELETMQQLYFDSTTFQADEDCAFSRLCEVRASRQLKASELFLDIAWLLRNPLLVENSTFFSDVNIQRVKHLLNYLTHTNSVNILKRVLHYLDSHVVKCTSETELNVWTESCIANMELIKTCIIDAKLILQKKARLNLVDDLVEERLTHDHVSQIDCRRHWPDSISGISNHVFDEPEEVDIATSRKKFVRPSVFNDEIYPLLSRYLLDKEGESCRMQVNRPFGSWHFARKVFSPRLMVLAMASVLVCCGLCAVLLHPHMTGRLTVYAKRCVFRATWEQ